ncbi:MAG TPA: HAMP domain-containing sensor histidine kinase [Pilimelia sp.]|nr:HAMP domain-containing sensor histidine kinase [Pilimelia sp.]
MASMVALAFLIPLALLVQELARERALADAERQTAVVVAVLAVTTEPAAVSKAISTADDSGGDSAGEPPTDGGLAVHGLRGVQVGTSHASPADVTLAAGQRQPLVATVEGGLTYLEPVDIGDSIAVVEVFVPDAALREGVETAWWALTVVAVGLVGASVLVGDRLAAKVVGSARSLARAAVALGDGDLAVRVEPSGPRELAEAGVAFNRMADRLAQSRTSEREMVADLSHRLRTPLTVLRLDAESLVEPSDDDAHLLETGEMFLGTPEEADRRRTVRRIRQAVASLEQEIDVLIRTTRQVVADVEEVVDQEVCDACEVVRERMQFWAAVAGDQNRSCTVTGAGQPAPVRLAKAELAAALDAVLGNVFRYTPQGTAFEVALSRRDGYVALRVDDAGTGIEDPDRALRRGASDRGSTGLGLDIARRATLAADGSVSIDRARLGGASVVMLFRDAEAQPRQASRFGLIGRLAGEPGARRWRKQRTPD